ncbi:hypothetical protein EMIT0P258_280011 [Pseudomonas sp. IT-P258]
MLDGMTGWECAKPVGASLLAMREAHSEVMWLKVRYRRNAARSKLAPTFDRGWPRIRWSTHRRSVSST